MLYVPLAQTVDYKQDMMKRIELQSHFIGGIMLVTNTPPGQLEPLLTKTLAELDPNLTIISFRTMQQQIELRFDQERAVASLFGIVALLLAAVGLYGVLAYTVAQRTREFGLRMALGAQPGRVRAMILGQLGAMTIIGAPIGLLGAVGLGRLAQSMLFQLQGSDPVVLIASVALLSLVAFGAGLIPAHRASRVDPMRALRYE